MTAHETTIQGDGAALAGWIKDNLPKPQVISLTATTAGVPSSVPVLLLPDGTGGMRAESVRKYFEEYRTAPETIKGKATLIDLDSFVQHANRNKMPGSVLFYNGNRDTPKLLVVYDYSDARNVGQVDQETGVLTFEPVVLAQPRLGQHRAEYAFPLSDEWKAWIASDGKVMDTAEFAEFIENRILDVDLPPEGDVTGEKLRKILGSNFATPAALLEVSRGLKLHVNHAYKGATNLSTGEMQFVWTEEHKDAEGGTVTVPNAFFVAIPVFRGETGRFGLYARLRYRAANGAVKWFYELFRKEETFEGAVKDRLFYVSTATALPLLTGTPEA